MSYDRQNGRAQRMTPDERMDMIEEALDLLTRQIADPANVINPSDIRLKRLQSQVRLIGSQIRSYQKLAQLKNSLTATISAAAKKPTREAISAAIAETTALSRAERRRLAREERKNKKALMNSTPALTAPDPVAVPNPEASTA